MEQPVAKWYFDVATLSCEMYPLGLCLDAVLIEKLALKSKKECEERCDVANVRQALESLQEGNSIGGEDAVHLSRPEAQIAPPAHLAIDDVIQESKHIRGRPLAIEPPTDLIHVIHVKSDAHVHNRESFELKEIDEAQLLTSEEKDVPTVTSGVLHVLEDAGNVEGSGDFENVEKSPKSIEKSFERFYRRNKESVICTQTAYRLLCPSGAASQFVYRWEKVDGICQSFPYGYCLHEANSAHPRTRAECEQFCD
uniref:BPTI/Kunitz inhibitor domain-containing protein n=1 Tax=Caenorhabditis japonica TaxID=281687 RepID=A0A8R1HP66_CAEJA